MRRLPAGPEIFLDTSALIGLVDSDDGLHEAAVTVMSSLESGNVSLVVSDAVLSEFLAYTASPTKLRAASVRAVDGILSSASTTVLPCGRTQFLGAFDLYRSRPDKEWSLVDCSSILICRQRGIRRVFTHDRHFRQAGFEILLS